MSQSAPTPSPEYRQVTGTFAPVPPARARRAFATLGGLTTIDTEALLEAPFVLEAS
jgi:hypothetical protein